MADYRKRLVDMTDEERAEVAPGAPQFSADYESVDDPLSVQMLEAGLDFTPVGTIKGISDIKDELSSDDPNYLKALGMGAVEAASIIPGAAPVVKGMIKGPLKSSSKIVTSKKDLGFDMGEPYDYDFTVKVEDIIDEWASGDISNAKLRKKLGDLDIKLGDRINPSADPSTLTIQMPDGRVFYGTGDIPSFRPLTLDAPVDAVDELGLSEGELSAWKQANYKKDKWRIPPEQKLQEAATALREGEITSKEFRELSGAFQPIVPLSKMPKFPTKKDVVQALHATDPRKTKKGIVGINKEIEDGTPISSRLDIPAYNSSDTWVVSLHDGTVEQGKSIGYSQTAVLNNVNFTTNPLAASAIASGKGKTTIARMQGEWQNADPEDVYATASELLNSDEWVQVGMNPYRASYFYDKADGMPLTSADQVIQVGPLVLAKNVKKTTPDDKQFEFFNKISGVTRNFNEGGAVMDEPMEASLGDANERIDPVSGNEVPIGSTPEEVRDDIPAMLSENEYVVPADVVRYYGVKFFEDLRNEAKTGFKEMQANGRIGGEPVGDTGMEMGGDDLPFDISELQMIDDDSEEQPEMNKGGYISGYAQGGMSVLPYNPALGSIFGTSAASGGTGSGFEIRTYLGPSGQKLYLQFLNGEPLSPIPEGYTLESGTSEQVSEQVSTTATTGSAASTVGAGQYTPTSGSDNDDGPINMPKPKKAVDWTNPEEATPDKFLETYNQMTGTGATVMKYAMGAVGGPLFGLGIKGAEKLQINSMISGIDSQIAAAKAAGKDTTNLIEIKNVIEGKNRDGTARADAGVSDAALSGATYKNNSFSESLANLFTPDDGASYVNGQLVDDNTGKPIQPGGMTDSGRKIAGWANDPENDIVTEETKAAAAQKVPAAFATTTKLPKIDPTREATLFYNPKGTNTKYMELANSLTPGDGRSYIGGQLIDEKTQEAYVPPKKDTVTTTSGQAVKINTESTKEGTVGAVVGGQYAGDGFEWKKAENGNYMTRTYTGTNEGATGSNSTSTSTSSSSQGSACFLTTAIVERRGEKDDGPTLTKLRKFRDTYLVTMPHEVEEYYNVAPKIVAAIPDTHSDWSWIGSQIDKSIGFIDKDLPNEAYKTYKSMVIKLKKDWI